MTKIIAFEELPKPKQRLVFSNRLGKWVSREVYAKFCACGDPATKSLVLDGTLAHRLVYVCNVHFRRATIGLPLLR